MMGRTSARAGYVHRVRIDKERENDLPRTGADIIVRRRKAG